jgi:hypothetical protein
LNFHLLTVNPRSVLSVGHSSAFVLLGGMHASTCTPPATFIREHACGELAIASYSVLGQDMTHDAVRWWVKGAVVVVFSVLAIVDRSVSKAKSCRASPRAPPRDAWLAPTARGGLGPPTTEELGSGRIEMAGEQSRACPLRPPYVPHASAVSRLDPFSFTPVGCPSRLGLNQCMAAASTTTDCPER